MKIKKIVKILRVVSLCLAVLGIASLIIVNLHVKSAAGEHFLSPTQAAQLEDADCIIVLGCGVGADGSLSGMLRDRLTRGLELYSSGAAKKLLMSGDHGRADYNEVGAMKQYAIDNGVPSEDVFMDHAGFSTYETMYRARDVFKARKVIIVTQEYHLYRAVYIARQLGLEAYGVSSDLHSYSGQGMRNFREVLARFKDFTYTVFMPEPTFLGEAIPVNGDGNLTND